MKDTLKNMLPWIAVCLLLMVAFNSLGSPHTRYERFTYSELVKHIQEGKIDAVVIHDNGSVTGTLNNDSHFTSYIPNTPTKSPILDELITKGITVNAKPAKNPLAVLDGLLSYALQIAMLIFTVRLVMAAGGGSAFSFSNSRARSIPKEELKITFKDVAGVDDAKAEVSDLVDFLKDPDKVRKLGGKVPRGILLMGEPGTGKTLLAKAVAGEAQVPFFATSGADFSEMFVGVGAARVRAMFEQARKVSPCIIFIDEIDAVGYRRNPFSNGSNEQTLNQLLVEMDGFAGNESVIVIAATNRPDVLDAALMRPGRFDRQVVINLPDIQGRYQILQVHLKRVKFDKKLVDPLVLAKGTPGMTGADLKNMVNEAALQAARLHQSKIDMVTFEKAKDKVLMGAERKMFLNPEEKRMTAYHESGHAIVGWRLISKGHDPIHKVTVIPRGRALGLTMYLPNEDRYSYTRQSLESRICGLFGGRVAEEIIFGKDYITTGAQNDIERATEIARSMVVKFGLSEKLGPLNYDDKNAHGNSKLPFSEKTTQAIDQEVNDIISHCYKTARKILEEDKSILHSMADMLVQCETLDASQIEKLMLRQLITVSEHPIPVTPSKAQVEEPSTSPAAKEAPTSQAE